MVPQDKITFNDHKVYIPHTMLKTNSENTVSFKFGNDYVTNSAGLHKYVDPQDKETYLYTHLEPFFCNRWFPCFDQPSLRAHLQISVIV
jgi:aminopeptidase N